MMLRLRGCEVYTFARLPAEGNLKAEIATAYGARYVSSREQTPQDLVKETGCKPDIIFEASGNSRVAFGAMEYLNLNGVLIWSSVTGGENSIDVPANRINLEWVLGNKLLVGTVNGNWRHFEQGLADLALGDLMYPETTRKILTHPVDGLDNYKEMMEHLENGHCLKVYMNVASE
jgi:glucose 1-dehydrogenase